MENEVVQRIALDRIVPDPKNRKQGGVGDLNWLANSIAAHGVQQPALVRPLKPDDPRRAKGAEYELIFGERRWRASQMADVDHLPCIVRDYMDSKALAVQLIENVHREDISPLDEADSYERLRDECGYDPKLIAQETGRSESHVYQRLRLARLVPEAKELLVEKKISAAVAVHLARLGEAQQRLVVKAQLTEWQIKRGVTAHDIDDWIRENILLDLKKVAWKMSDAALVKKAGPCAACVKRTGADPALFEDVSGDKCMDPVCFKAKSKAIFDKNLAEVEAVSGLVVMEHYGYYGKIPAIHPGDWKEVKKKDEGAQKAIVVDGDAPGRLTWAVKVERAVRVEEPEGFDNEEDKPEEVTKDMSPEEAAEVQERNSEREKERAEEALRHKREEAHKEINRRLFGLILEACRKAETHLSFLKVFVSQVLCEADVTDIAPVFGWTAPDGSDYEVQEAVALEAIEEMTVTELLTVLLVTQINGALSVNRWGRPIYEPMAPYLELYRIDPEEIRAQVHTEMEIPEEELGDEELDEDGGDDGDPDEAESEEEDAPEDTEDE